MHAIRDYNIYVGNLSCSAKVRLQLRREMPNINEILFNLSVLYNLPFIAFIDVQSQSAWLERSGRPEISDNSKSKLRLKD